jgi:phytoene desaturase
MYSIISALVQLAEEMGVTFYYNTTVEEIITSNDSKKRKVIGLKTKQHELIKYDKVVSNMDIYYTFKKLLPNEKAPEHILNQPKSSSLIAFFWGVKNTYEKLNTHNMLFSADDEREFKSVFENNKLSDDPSIYIYVSSKHVKEDAPEGCENWFLFVTVPNDQGQNWDELVVKARKSIVGKINRLLNTDIEQDIEFEEVLTPAKIKENYSTPFGAIYGNSSHNKFAAFFRHSNFSKKVNGLYFVGGSVHPGAGIPLCLNSAKIMDKTFKA